MKSKGYLVHQLPASQDPAPNQGLTESVNGVTNSLAFSPHPHSSPKAEVFLREHQLWMVQGYLQPREPSAESMHLTLLRTHSRDTGPLQEGPQAGQQAL